MTASAETELLLQLWLQQCVPRTGATVHVFRYLPELQQHVEVELHSW